MLPLFACANSISQTVVYKELWNKRTNITPTTESCWCYCRKICFCESSECTERPSHLEYRVLTYSVCFLCSKLLIYTTTNCSYMRFKGYNKVIKPASLMGSVQVSYCPSWLEDMSFHLIHFYLRMMIFSGLLSRTHWKQSLSNAVGGHVSASTFHSESYTCVWTLKRLVLLLWF